MPSAAQQETIHPTLRGDVRLMPSRSADEIDRYTFSNEFGSYAQFKSLYTKRESLAQIAAETGANVTLALDQTSCIIGFGVLAYPDPDERWSQLGAQVMMEVKAVEVARSWRSCRVADGIIRTLLAGRAVERKIVYMVGYSWTWDLDHTHMDGMGYRGILIALFEPHGFIEMQTNDPNICLKPENLFMARVGAEVTAETAEQFKWLRFGVSP